MVIEEFVTAAAARKTKSVAPETGDRESSTGAKEGGFGFRLGHNVGVTFEGESAGRENDIEDASFETNFDAVLQIYSEDDDEPLETTNLLDIADASSSERIDYYQVFEMNVPSHIESGRYRIRLRLHDRNSDRRVEHSVTFGI